MLLRPGGLDFTTGRSTYTDHDLDSPEPTAKIFVKITAAELAGNIVAQLDTAAPWSILNVEVAEAMSLLDGDGEPVSILTKDGRINGRLERASLEIVADEGDTLSVNATFLVSADWGRVTFLGYGGLLDHMCFAVDPSDNSFHFGPLQAR